MSLSISEFSNIVTKNCSKSISLVDANTAKKELNIVTNMDYDENILKEQHRLSVHPIQHQDLWNLYLKQRASFWVPEEVSLADDRNDFEKLNSYEQKFIKNILAFFSTADGLVIDNITESLFSKCNVLEIEYLYRWQISMEQIHADMYGQMLREIVTDDEERKSLTDSISNIPCIAEKNSWGRKWACSSAPFVQLLVANAIVEGISFSGSFCAIYWIRKKNLMKGLTTSNEFISRDENMHCETAYHIYTKYIKHKLPEEVVFEMVADAVNVEKKFINDSLQCDLIGMNTTLMGQYIEYIADVLLQNLEHNVLYGTKNPFDFMVNINMQKKENFFEVRVTNYNKGGDDDVEEKNDEDSDDENF